MTASTPSGMRKAHHFEGRNPPHPYLLFPGTRCRHSPDTRRGASRRGGANLHHQRIPPATQSGGLEVRRPEQLAPRRTCRQVEEIKNAPSRSRLRFEPRPSEREKKQMAADERR